MAIIKEAATAVLLSKPDTSICIAVAAAPMSNMESAGSHNHAYAEGSISDEPFESTMKERYVNGIGNIHGEPTIDERGLMDRPRCTRHQSPERRSLRRSMSAGRTRIAINAGARM